MKNILIFLFAIGLFIACDTTPNGTDEGTSEEAPAPSEIEDTYTNITGQYDAEVNAGGMSVATANIDYLGNNSFNFRITTGHETGCTGEISGAAQINDKGIANFSREGCENLTFKFMSNGLEIEESGCDEFHGIKCAFGGEYKRVE